MARGTSYLDLLDDRLVQKVIESILGHRRTGEWRCLSSCCRRLCGLVSREPDLTMLEKQPSCSAHCSGT
jgi:hypothetical protein